MPFYPTNKKARWLQVSRTRGCLQQPGGCSQGPLPWPWDISGARHGRNAATSVSPVRVLVITGVEASEENLSWESSRAAWPLSAAVTSCGSMCHTDCWLSPPPLSHRHLHSRTWGKVAWWELRGWWKEERRGSGKRLEQGGNQGVLHLTGQEILLGLQNGSSLSLEKARVLHNLVGQLP